MSPIRRERVIEWDESLTGLQDWDYFRRIVKAGGIGKYLPCGPNAVSAGFETEWPDKESVSGGGRDKFIERHNAVKKKHGDAESDFLVYGRMMKPEAITVARLMNADYFMNPVWVTKEYKAVMSVGFNPQDADVSAQVMKMAGENAKRIIYWPGQDVAGILYGPYIDVKDLAEKLKNNIHFHLCDDVRSKHGLEEMGIKATIKSLPKAVGDVLHDIPKDFRILAFSDKDLEPQLDSIIRSLPDIEIDKVEYGKHYSYDKYTLGIHLSAEERLSTSSKNMLLHGRHLISNVQEPYSGFLDMSDATLFKAEVIKKVRELQEAPTFNKKAQDYYMNELSPERFKEFIDSLCSSEASNV